MAIDFAGDHEVSMEQPKPNTKPTREERIQSDFGSDGAANGEFKVSAVCPMRHA